MTWLFVGKAVGVLARLATILGRCGDLESPLKVAFRVAARCSAVLGDGPVANTVHCRMGQQQQI